MIEPSSKLTSDSSSLELYRCNKGCIIDRGWRMCPLWFVLQLKENLHELEAVQCRWKYPAEDVKWRSSGSRDFTFLLLQFSDADDQCGSSLCLWCTKNKWKKRIITGHSTEDVYMDLSWSCVYIVYKTKVGEHEKVRFLIHTGYNAIIKQWADVDNWAARCF